MIATDTADGASPPMRPGLDRLSLSEELLDAALGALRQGTLELLVRQQPLAARWLMRRFLPIVKGTLGDAWSAQVGVSEVPGLMLRWLITQLRPDLEPRLDGIPDDAWLNLVAWRPMIAVMCQARLAVVPAFPARYRKRADEAAVDTLCGLWDVGPSTFYRYLERGKRQMAQVAIEVPLAVPRRFSLRRFVAAEQAMRLRWRSGDERVAWHRSQVSTLLRQRRDPVSALWHALQAADIGLAADTLRAYAPVLAGDPETDALIDRLAALSPGGRALFDLWTARAALARTRNATDREMAALERALQVATEAADPLLLGMAYGALGRFHEARDGDRAFACYQDSAKFLLAADPRHDNPDIVAQYVTTLVRSAWMYVLRSHPKAKAMLEEADRLRLACAVPDEVEGQLEQSWGEYWRIAGETQRALQAKHRALNVFERLGDRRSVLVTYLNLITLYGESKDLARAQWYGDKVFDFARTSVVEPSILASTHLNLGFGLVLSGHYERAITEFRSALDLCESAGLRLHANRARFNLANAYYRRAIETRAPDLERLGDAQLDALFRAPASEQTPALAEAARRLKSEVFGQLPAERAVDRLLGDEYAEHLEEMSEIQRQRSLLQSTESPEERARAHLAIANAYLAISAKERDAARELLRKHGIGESLLPELSQLRDTFDRGLTHEERVHAQWRDGGTDLLDEVRRSALLLHLLRTGTINKSTYAELCNVSPATASKHLTALAERGLLQQTGKGPSTRYLLRD